MDEPRLQPADGRRGTRRSVAPAGPGRTTMQQMMMTMVTIDGSSGEGGGQVLRTALALSLATGRPFRIDNIRARRKKPGLLRQHLTAVQAATAVGEARVEGAALGSNELTFAPRTVK